MMPTKSGIRINTNYQLLKTKKQMKTNSKINWKTARIISSVLIIAVSFLFLKGCEKAEMPQVKNLTNGTENSDASASSNMDNTAKQIPFLMLTIDHSAARTGMPDYRVELNSHGEVFFNGRRNTAYAGVKRFKVSNEIVVAIRNQFTMGNFLELETLPSTPDLPLVTTSFRSSINNDIFSKIDYGQPQSEKLILLRQYAENMLELTSLINKGKNIDDVKENPNQIAQ
jgi:hypothetical protein